VAAVFRFTQGVVNTKIDGVPVRIYSVAKTIADCLKYRRKLGPDFTVQALQESIVQGKCSRERLQHFTKICRVKTLLDRVRSEQSRSNKVVSTASN
jgi:predicted transcriptional regulator of viral defense system